jgi:hypothetical protein
MELSDAMEKPPATPGIDPGTFRLVAQCFNDCDSPGLFDRLISGNLVMGANI